MAKKRRSGHGDDDDALPLHEVRWSRAMFEMMAERGVWGVPRSGLLFQKQGDTLVLIEQMPWESGMPGTAAELREYQEYDYNVIAKRFRAAGIRVRRGGRA